MLISSDIEANWNYLNETFENCFDVVKRRILDANKRAAVILFVDGLSDKDMIQQSVVSPLLGFAIDVKKLRIKNIDDLREKLVSSVDVKIETDMQKTVKQCLSGDAVVFVDGANEALIIQTRKWQSRSISPPEIQRSVRGSREGFTETMLFNVSMLRRRLKTPKLKTEILNVGSISKTDVCLCYLKGVAKEPLIDLIRARIAALDIKYIMESGHIEQLIEDERHTLFSTTGNNEKPDVVAAKLIKGRVAIVVDGTPFVLTAPMLFSENFQSPEDYYSRPFYANFIRVLRFLSYFVTLTLPALYVALVSYHNEMIPAKLLSTLILASEGVPMNTALEMILLLLIYELLREALLRLPQSVGTGVSIVGVLIIGEAAVGVNLIGAPSVVVAAITYITSSVVSPLRDSNSLIRLLFLILGALFGAYGVFLGIFAVIVHLASLSSYGCPYLLPIAPVRISGIKDSVLRLNIREILRKEGY